MIRRPLFTTEEELRTVMPPREKLPLGWQYEEWWSLSRGTSNHQTARVYLNGHGTDHELRFIVWHPQVQEVDCYGCNGTGRVERPKSETLSIFHFFGNGEPDPADANGLRRCLVSGCRDGKVPSTYGASNSFIRAPGLIERHPNMENRLGNRGLSYPDVEDTLAVIAWIDELYPRLLKGETP